MNKGGRYYTCRPVVNDWKASNKLPCAGSFVAFIVFPIMVTAVSQKQRQIGLQSFWLLTVP